MKQVSEEVEAIFQNLVAWELLGRTDLNPKELLRQIPLPDLRIVAENIESLGLEIGENVCAQLVQLELAYRLDQIVDDWEITIIGVDVNITYKPVQPVKYLYIKMQLQDPGEPP